MEVHNDDIQQHTIEASTGTVPNGTEVPTEEFLYYTTVTVPSGIANPSDDIQQHTDEASTGTAPPVRDIK